jgi:hypothetical protein
MARISIYQKDTDITSQDKVIGTDFNGSVTKNFPLGGLSNFFSRTITVGGQVAYQFVDIKKNASLTEPADDTAFSALTTFKLSEIDSAGHNVENFLLEYAGKRIIITQVDNKNNYGFYDVTSVIEDENNLNYYDFILKYVSGHGNLILNKYYTIMLAGGEKDKHYTHNQGIASATWNVSHNLNKFPSVTVVLSTGQKGYADVSYTDTNNLTITFTGAETGKAYMN